MDFIYINKNHIKLFNIKNEIKFSIFFFKNVCKYIIVSSLLIFNRLIKNWYNVF